MDLSSINVDPGVLDGLSICRDGSLVILSKFINSDGVVCTIVDMNTNTYIGDVQVSERGATPIYVPHTVIELSDTEMSMLIESSQVEHERHNIFLEMFESLNYSNYNTINFTPQFLRSIITLQEKMGEAINKFRIGNDIAYTVIYNGVFFIYSNGELCAIQPD